MLRFSENYAQDFEDHCISKHCDSELRQMLLQISDIFHISLFSLGDSESILLDIQIRSTTSLKRSIQQDFPLSILYIFQSERLVLLNCFNFFECSVFRCIRTYRQKPHIRSRPLFLFQHRGASSGRSSSSRVSGRR